MDRAPRRGAGEAEARLILRVPSAYHAAYFECTYGDAIRRAAAADLSIQSVRIVA